MTGESEDRLKQVGKPPVWEKDPTAVNSEMIQAIKDSPLLTEEQRVQVLNDIDEINKGLTDSNAS